MEAVGDGIRNMLGLEDGFNNSFGLRMDDDLAEEAFVVGSLLRGRCELISQRVEVKALV